MCLHYVPYSSQVQINFVLDNAFLFVSLREGGRGCGSLIFHARFGQQRISQLVINLAAQKVTMTEVL